MKNRAFYKSGWLRAAMAIMAGVVLCTVVGLTGCGGGSTTEQSESTEQSTPTEQATTAGPAEVYVFSKTVLKSSTGATMTEVFDFDDQGRQLKSQYEEVSEDSPLKSEYVMSEWDEYGHYLKAQRTYNYSDNNSLSTDEDITYDLNEDGTVAKMSLAMTINRDGYAEDEFATQTETTTYEYGSTAEVVKKAVTQTESYDQSGTLLQSDTRTMEYDEDGLQTGFTRHTVTNEDKEFNTTITVTWTKDADGKPTAFQMVMDAGDGGKQTATGDVTLDESGQISKLNNFVVDGEARSTTFEVERKRIENPLPNGYEGWKSFPLTDFLITNE